ncbi:MAG TPA: anaerobic ribonucleoside-triphosphate reductase activating protein [Exilispira sp.]|nr:anaerobic ribonucleoside-triphosphate reductase activating protein [Exilispira sp.]
MLEIKGFIPVSLIDYPSKICSVIFLGGCNFRCPWCHNFDLVDEKVLPNIKNIPFDYILNHIEKRKGKIDGICISGGEPTIHGQQLIDLIYEIKKKKILVKLDTNGSNPEVVEELIMKKIIDFISIDIKNIPEKYPQTIGLQNFDFSKIIKTLQIVKENKIEFQARTTLVEKIVDRTQMEKLAKKLNIDIVFQDYRRKN